MKQVEQEMNWKGLLESASESDNDDLRLRHEHLLAENRIMRQQITGRVQLTDYERMELAEIGAKSGQKALEEIATIAKPTTILAWNRKFADQKIDTAEPRKSAGRPRVDREIEELVIRMARENRSWGYDRIQGVMNHLGYTISDQTVGNILKRHHISPAPERKKTVTWREFTRAHLDVLLATGFFASEVWNRFGFIISYWHSFVRCGRRQAHSVVITRLLAGTAQIPRGLQPAQLYQSALGHSSFEDVISESQKSSFQDISKVISLSRIKPDQIRNGPRQHPPWLDQQGNDVDREAA